MGKFIMKKENVKKPTTETVTSVATPVTNANQINQGDIVEFDFSPAKGHEQAGDTSALVLSDKAFHKITGFIVTVPINKQMDDFPGHVKLGKTEFNVVTGNVFCEKIRSIDFISRNVKIVDKASKETLEECIKKVIASISLKMLKNNSTTETATNVVTPVTNVGQINQGDIVKFDFSPVVGHEQANYRPGLVLSDKAFNEINNMIIVLPITNDMDDFPGHVKLDKTIFDATTGNILCEHIRSIDPITRKTKIVDKASKETLEKCHKIITASIALK